MCVGDETPGGHKQHGHKLSCFNKLETVRASAKNSSLWMEENMTFFFMPVLNSLTRVDREHFAPEEYKLC